ncbi:hypothetical protein Golomagni_07346 [Golovinomyces magnicellulatus]|nr:hypothetical protein Golomagni_07346 [Golovinomyces magnicellulatus]
MPSDDYVAVGGGGALKLKGAKINKKKKKKSTKTDLEKNLADGGSSKEVSKKDKDPQDEQDDHEDDGPAPMKTESERRHDEIRRKRLLEVAGQSGSRPELLKTHKERVEELNTYLSKLSEHHDMPKIGPG